MKELKALIKANFEHNDFDTALEMNEVYLEKYAAEKSERSAKAIVAYYRKKAEQETLDDSIEETQTSERAQETSNEVSERGAFQSEVKPKKPTDAQTPTNVLDLRLAFNKQIGKAWIFNALANNASWLDEYCVVREYWELKSDEEQVRALDVFITRDEILKPSGFSSLADAQKAAKDAGLKTYREHGKFDNSRSGYPVGEKYCYVGSMKIRDAFNWYGKREDNGITSFKKI